MSICKQIEKILSKNKIYFFKGSENNKNIYNIPYRGIKNEHYHINIYLEILEKSNLVKFMLIEKANVDIDIDELKSSLLDMNSSLKLGKLSMRNDSDTVEFNVDYQICDDCFSIDQYNQFILLCITIYEDLKEKKFIR